MTLLTQRDFSVAYVNVPMRRRVNGVVHKGASEVLKVPLADLADPAGEHVIELLSVGV